MKSITIAFAAFLIVAGLGIAFAQDFVKPIGGTPLIKDLGNLSMQEINAIFSGDGAWLDSQNTPTIDAFRKPNEADGKPLVPAKKAAFVGSVWAAKNGNVSPEGVPA